MLAAHSTPFSVVSVKSAIACWAVLLLASSTAVLADVYSYECDSLPKTAGWALLQVLCEAQQWTQDGLLFQEVPLCEEFPGFGGQIDHEKDIENLSGVESWFAEWRVITTGISEELIYTAPAALVVWDGDGLVYHFTIADDRVRFIRQLGTNPTLYFDIEPLVPHIFRVELFGADLGSSFVVYIDGEIVDSGEAEGPLLNPPHEAGVKFRARSKFVPSVTTWEYMRWGEVPIPGSGDMTCDGEVDFDDLPFFLECLNTPAGAWAGCVWADMDGSGDVDCTDWELFREAWTDPVGPPSIPECDCNSAADLNCDGSVGPFDLATLLGSWGPCADPPAGCPADLNGDGTVGPADLAMLLGSWG